MAEQIIRIITLAYIIPMLINILHVIILPKKYKPDREYQCVIVIVALTPIINLVGVAALIFVYTELIIRIVISATRKLPQALWNIMDKIEGEE